MITAVLFILRMRMRVRVSVVVAVAVRMSMIMTVVAMMSKTCHADQVDGQTHSTDDKELCQSFRWSILCQSLDCLNHNLDTDKPGTC